MDLTTQLSKFFQLERKIIETIINLREDVFFAEHQLMKKKNKKNLTSKQFYTNSLFSLFSNAKDEFERDTDTDWYDMMMSLTHTMKPVKSILDFGCGIASASYNFVKQYKYPVDSITLYDLNKLALLFAKHRFKTISIKTKTTYVFYRKYDLILLWGVLEHLQDDEAFQIMTKLKKQLTKHGKFFIKNFYHQKDPYLLHFDKGTKMEKWFQENDKHIIFAKNSHV